MTRLGIDMPRSALAYTVEEPRRSRGPGLPGRHPARLHAGRHEAAPGYTSEELRVVAQRGITASLIGQSSSRNSVLQAGRNSSSSVRDARTDDHGLLHRKH